MSKKQFFRDIVGTDQILDDYMWLQSDVYRYAIREFKKLEKDRVMLSFSKSNRDMRSENYL